MFVCETCSKKSFSTRMLAIIEEGFVCRSVGRCELCLTFNCDCFDVYSGASNNWAWKSDIEMASEIED